MESKDKRKEKNHSGWVTENDAINFTSVFQQNLLVFLSFFYEIIRWIRHVAFLFSGQISLFDSTKIFKHLRETHIKNDVKVRTCTFRGVWKRIIQLNYTVSRNKFFQYRYISTIDTRMANNHNSFCFKIICFDFNELPVSAQFCNDNF